MSSHTNNRIHVSCPVVKVFIFLVFKKMPLKSFHSSKQKTMYKNARDRNLSLKCTISCDLMSISSFLSVCWGRFFKQGLHSVY